MTTPTEKRIQQQRRATSSGAILVPVLEELLETPVEIEDEEDFRYMDMLVRARAIPRSKGVFSPSMLGSCVRQAYFSKRGEEKLAARNPQTNGYFLKGNFVHLQWQFALWKAHRAGKITLIAVPVEREMAAVRSMVAAKSIPKEAGQMWIDALCFYDNETRPAVEVRVVDGDWGGTIDAIVMVDGKLYIVDFKGINLIEFQRTMKSGAKVAYRRQIVGYGMIAADLLSLDVDGCLLVSESKAGPLSGRGSPIALHETFVPIPDHSGDVMRRLRTLRWFDAKEELPPAECVSTNHMGFQECAFNRYCRDEVREVQRARENRAAQQPRDWKPSRPSR